MEKFTLEENRQYWDDPDTKSLIDKNLKEIEIAFMSKHLNSDDEIVDIGCGDGETSLRISKKVKTVTAIERSDYLRSIAKRKILESGVNNIVVESGDILKLDYENRFDAAITERVLINLPSWELQLEALTMIHRCLKPWGIYLMVENANDGSDALNKLREIVGLKPIPVHWHNLYFDYEVFCEGIKDKFEIVERTGFSLYYFLTRLYTQMFATFEGFGIKAKKDELFEISDKAARLLHEQFGDQVTFNENNNILGPIQGFVLRKKLL